jgi:hypothetical protein
MHASEAYQIALWNAKGFALSLLPRGSPRRQLLDRVDRAFTRMRPQTPGEHRLKTPSRATIRTRQEGRRARWPADKDPDVGGHAGR